MLSSISLCKSCRLPCKHCPHGIYVPPVESHVVREEPKPEPVAMVDVQCAYCGVPMQCPEWFYKFAEEVGGHYICKACTKIPPSERTLLQN